MQEIEGGRIVILGKKRRIGRDIEKIVEGEKLKLTEKIEDKDLLLYLGLTNDSNPLYIQHDYASQTEFDKPACADNHVERNYHFRHFEIFAWSGLTCYGTASQLSRTMCIIMKQLIFYLK